MLREMGEAACIEHKKDTDENKDFIPAEIAS